MNIILNSKEGNMISKTPITIGAVVLGVQEVWKLIRPWVQKEGPRFVLNQLKKKGVGIALVTIGYLAEHFEEAYPDLYKKLAENFRNKWVPTMNIMNFLVTYFFKNYHTTPPTGNQAKEARSTIYGHGPEGEKYFNDVSVVGTAARDLSRTYIKQQESRMSPSFAGQFFSKFKIKNEEMGDEMIPMPTSHKLDPVMSSFFNQIPLIRDNMGIGYSTDADYKAASSILEAGDVPIKKRTSMAGTIGALKVKYKYIGVSNSSPLKSKRMDGHMKSTIRSKKPSAIIKEDKDIKINDWMSKEALQSFVTVNINKASQTFKLIIRGGSKHPANVMISAFNREVQAIGIKDPMVRTLLQPYLLPWLYATCFKESRFNQFAKGGLGEIGYLQLMQNNAIKFGNGLSMSALMGSPKDYGSMAARFFISHFLSVAKRYNTSITDVYFKNWPDDAKAFIYAANLENVPTLGMVVMLNQAWQGGYNPKMLNPNSKWFPESKDRLILYALACNALSNIKLSGLESADESDTIASINDVSPIPVVSSTIGDLTNSSFISPKTGSKIRVSTKKGESVESAVSRLRSKHRL